MIYGVYHWYDVDGGFGDAIPQKDLLCVFLNKEEADKFVKEYEDVHIYDDPYSELACGLLVIEELPTVFDPKKAWWKGYLSPSYIRRKEEMEKLQEEE